MMGISLKCSRFYFSLIVILILFCSEGIFAQCSCPSSAPGGATVISSANSSTYILSSGVIYITSAGSFTGTLALSSTGTVYNFGTVSPTSFTMTGGTFVNCGTFSRATTASISIGGGTFSNCNGASVSTGASFSVSNASTAVIVNNYGGINIFDNTGSFNVQDNATINNYGPYGSICLPGGISSFNMQRATARFNNYGSLTTQAFNTQQTSIFYNQCNVTVNGNLLHQSPATISGPTSGTVYGRFTVAGLASNSGIFGSTASDKLDLCKGGCSTGASCWTAQTGTVGAAVTYCANSGCTSTLDCTGSLPVELISFAAECNDKKVQLKWSTASETNNDFFTVERSTDGMNFEFVAKINGFGTSTQRLYYGVTDDSPHAGISYYRLKQTDYNGDYAYSDIIAINNSKKGDYSLIVSNSVDAISVNYSCVGYSGVVDVQIINTLGQVVSATKQYVEDSNNTFDLSTEKIPTGLYFVKISNKENSIQKRIIK